MNWYKLFYWITVAERVQNFILTIAIVFTIFLFASIITTIIAKVSYNITTYVADKDKNTLYLAWMKKINRLVIPIFLIAWLFYICIPSKSDTVLIVAGGAVGNFLQSDSASKQIPSDLMKFLNTQVQELTSEAKANLGIYDAKTKKLKDLKNLTQEELYEKIKTDTSFSKLAQ